MAASGQLETLKGPWLQIDIHNASVITINTLQSTPAQFSTSAHPGANQLHKAIIIHTQLLSYWRVMTIACMHGVTSLFHGKKPSNFRNTVHLSVSQVKLQVGDIVNPIFLVFCCGRSV